MAVCVGNADAGDECFDVAFCLVVNNVARGAWGAALLNAEYWAWLEKEARKEGGAKMAQRTRRRRKRCWEVEREIMWEYAIETAHDTSGRIHAGRKRGNIRPFLAQNIDIVFDHINNVTPIPRSPFPRASASLRLLRRFAVSSPFSTAPARAFRSRASRGRLERPSPLVRHPRSTTCSDVVRPRIVRRDRADARPRAPRARGPRPSRARSRARARASGSKDASEPPSRREVLAAPGSPP